MILKTTIKQIISELIQLTFRQATLQDLPELKRLFAETILETCKNEYTQGERIVWSNAIYKTEKWKIAVLEEYFIVAEYDEQIVGFSSLKGKDYLNLMYIHKEFTRHGIASLLYKKIKAKSLEFGAKQLTSDVSKTARPFFEKMGFKVIQENKNIIEDQVVINYKMSE